MVTKGFDVQTNRIASFFTLMVCQSHLPEVFFLVNVLSFKLFDVGVIIVDDFQYMGIRSFPTRPGEAVRVFI